MEKKSYLLCPAWKRKTELLQKGKKHVLEWLWDGELRKESRKYLAAQHTVICSNLGSVLCFVVFVSMMSGEGSAFIFSVCGLLSHVNLDLSVLIKNLI